jgi:hypothetical protein
LGVHARPPSKKADPNISSPMAKYRVSLITKRSPRASLRRQHTRVYTNSACQRSSTLEWNAGVQIAQTRMQPCVVVVATARFLFQAGGLLCQKCARIDVFRPIGVSVERRAQSPSGCWSLQSADTRPRQEGSGSALFGSRTRQPLFSIQSGKAGLTNSDGCRPPQLNLFCSKNLGASRNHPNLRSTRRVRVMNVCLVSRCSAPCLAEKPEGQGSATRRCGTLVASNALRLRH